ncbi:MAG: toll/interleukin-1 receptor domain-containing protein, partial [Bacteroidota bacterium]
MPKTSPTVFISYARDDDAHKEWVKMLADRLLNNRIEVLLDQYDATAGTNFIHFMEQAVSKADYIVMILTPNYKTKSDQRLKGVGYEQ